MVQILEVLERDVQTSNRFTNVETRSNFGSDYSHEEFISELVRQNENREDFIFNASDAQFVGTKFLINDTVYDLDPVSLISLAERFKISGTHSITRTGLSALSFEPSLFEQTANFFLGRIKKPLQFRTMFDIGLAFPSKDYTIVNNLDFISTVLNTVEEITENVLETKKHYLHKELMYCYLPIEGLNVSFVTSEGREETLELGLELRNSEILQNGISIAFKVIIGSTQEGFLLTNGINQIYHRHIGMTTAETLNAIRKDLISLFTSDSLTKAFQVMEFLQVLMQTPSTVSILENEGYLKLFNLSEKEIPQIEQIYRIQNKNSLYSRTLGLYSQFVRAKSTNRQRIEDQERVIGDILSGHRLRELINN